MKKKLHCNCLSLSLKSIKKTIEFLFLNSLDSTYEECLGKMFPKEFLEKYLVLEQIGKVYLFNFLKRMVDFFFLLG